METFTISKFSVIAPMISDDGIFVNDFAAFGLRDIRRKCKEQNVEIHFLPDDKVRIIGRENRLVKVPAKCVKSSAILLLWLNERISKAWKGF